MKLIADQALPLAGGRAATAGVVRRASACTRSPASATPSASSRCCASFGIAVVPHAFADHHRYSAADFEFGSRLPVLMTEKDAVKCAALATDAHFSVPVHAELPEAFWVSLLDKLPSRNGEGA